MQQKPLLGFSLALTATAMWGMLPIAAQQVLAVMDAPTLVWYRFVVAALGLLMILGFAKKLPKLTACSPRIWGIIVLGVLGLAANFVLFSHALHYISPTTNQVLWQLAPFTMVLCGVVLFKEKFGTHQKLGLVLLIAGLIAFFNNRFGEILQFGDYAWGILFGAAASIIWVVYGVGQKLLLAKFTSQQILMIIYIGCSLVLSPVANVEQIHGLSGFVLACFIFCCCNTLIGYGAYAEALNHWDASKVSVVTILTPIFTMIFSGILHAVYPTVFAASEMNALSYVGAFVVVAGTILSAVGHKLFKPKTS